MPALITVANVQPPAPGKKMASVYDTQGNRWLIFSNSTGQYAPGASYNIEFESSMFNGKQYNKISSATLVAASAPAGNVVPMQQAPQRAIPAQQFGGQTQAPNENTRRLDIFICGAFNNMLSNPQVNPLLLSADDLTNFIKSVKQAWVNTLGRPADRGDMNDEIPF